MLVMVSISPKPYSIFYMTSVVCFDESFIIGLVWTEEMSRYAKLIGFSLRSMAAIPINDCFSRVNYQFENLFSFSFSFQHLSLCIEYSLYILIYILSGSNEV